MPYGLSYAGADNEYSESEVFLFGARYDYTASFRAGAREGPDAIRRASYNFEEIHFEHGIEQYRPSVHDYGNVDDFLLPEDMISEVEFTVTPAVNDGKFVVAIGGEHSINIPVIRSFPKDISLISIDAHLDSREEYLGTPYSHACITRRAVEHLGSDNVWVLGARAIGAEELEHEDPVNFISSYEIFENGIENTMKTVLDEIGNERIYITLDIDGIDPAYAPGTGTPEPFGMLPLDVKKAINMVGDRLCGFDVTEVSPPYDPSGITSILASRFINEAIAVYGKGLR